MGDAGDHGAAQDGFAEMEGRCAQVEEEIKALGCEFRDGVSGVKRTLEKILRPNILANGHSDAVPAPCDGIAGCAGFKIAALVENVVSGQESFPDSMFDFAIFQPSDGIAKGFSWVAGVVVVHVAHEKRHLADFSGQVVKRLQAMRDKLRFEHQIARRIAHEREFRRDDQVSPGVEALAVGGENSFYVPGKIPDDGIDLSEADLHERR